VELQSQPERACGLVFGDGAGDIRISDGSVCSICFRCEVTAHF
jgi:hypothetical protein